MAGNDRDATLSKLHRHVSQRLEGWNGAAGGTGALPWWDSALTRVTLLVGEDEPRWTYGPSDASRLWVLTDRVLVTCAAPTLDDGASARVWADALRNISRVELEGGDSPFGGSIDRRWPGRVTLTLHMADGSTNSLPIDDVERSGVLEVWDVLLGNLRAS